MVVSHSSHAGEDYLALTWQLSDQSDTTGSPGGTIMATVTTATGETIQAVASCDDSFTNAQTGSDEDIQFSVFRGNDGADLNWDGGVVTLAYTVDGNPEQTTNVSEHYGNAATVEVAYSDMSTAKHFTVDLPLANGNDPVVDLNPRDPVMLTFTEVCEKQFLADFPPVAPVAPAAPRA
jgi:hypothetical protein